MSLLGSFIFDGDKLSLDQLKAIRPVDPKLIESNCELILFFNERPSLPAIKVLEDYQAVRCYWAKNRYAQSAQKAVLCAAGAWIIFTSFENLIEKNGVISKEIKDKNSGYIICRFNQRLPKFLKKIGFRDISAAPYIAVERYFAQHISYNGSRFNFKDLLKLADKNAKISFIYSPGQPVPSFLGYRVIFFRPYLKMATRLSRWITRRSLGKIRSLPRYVLVKLVEVKKQIEATRAKTISYSSDIPVFIITRDRLEPLKKLVKWIEEEGLTNIIFVDNASTYPPLLRYFEVTSYEVVRLANNVGHKSPWTEGVIAVYASGRPFIVTDPDILPDENTHGAVKYFAHLLNKYKERVKVGFALHIDDLPDHFELKQNVITWETQFWGQEIEKDVYDAPVDTTFALYRANVPHSIQPALRTGRFQARHEPWYIDSSNPDAEVTYYRKHVDKVVGTWGVKKGDMSGIYVDYEKLQDS